MRWHRCRMKEGPDIDQPQEIRRFAAMGGLACLINFIAALLTLNLGFQVLAGALIGAAILIGLILWVVLGRSMIGRLVATIWIAFAAGSSIGSYALLFLHHRVALMSPIVHLLSLATIPTYCGALYFLWRDASTAWLQKGADAS